MGRNIYLFVLGLFLAMAIPFTLNQEAMVNADDLKFQYNEAIDNASGAAAKALLIPTTNDSHEIMSYGNIKDFQTTDLNLKEGLDRFDRSLYLNLDIENNVPEQQALLNKVPIIVAAGYEGYYVHTWQIVNVNGKIKATNDWTAEKKYSVFDKTDNIKISYTLDDYVYIQDVATGQQQEGNRQTFASKYPSYFSDATFNTVRSQVMNKLIQNDLNSYTYTNNSIAKRFNWGLSFNTPLWGDRAITTVSFVAFVQGKLTVGAPTVYNSYGFGTAKIVKRKKIYGYIENGLKLYSTENTGDNLLIFDTPIEAAENGYSPDPVFYNPSSTVKGSGIREVNFASSINQSQSQTITIPNLSKIDSITTDNGNVNYSTNGDNVTINVSNGTATSVLNNQKSFISASNSLTNSTNIFPDTNPYSDSNGNTGTLTKNGSSVVSSGSYTPASNKTVTATSANYSSASQVPPTYSYSDSNGYSGLLWETGLIVNSTGSQLASSKTVSASSGIYSSSYLVPPTYAYSDANGYSGILQGTGIIKTQTGGSYTSGGSDTATASSASYSSPLLVPATYYYNDGRYSGILNGTGLITTQTGGSYTPSYSKTVSASSGNYFTASSVPSSYYYNDGIYSGLLYGTGVIDSTVQTGGSYTAPSSKYVTGQSSANYNSGGFSGTLTKYLVSGGPQVGNSKTIVEYIPYQTLTYDDYVRGMDWSHYSHNTPDPIPTTYYYNDGIYSGNLTADSAFNIDENTICYQPPLGWTDGVVLSSINNWELAYNGTVSCPAYDNSVYAYEGTVTNPGSDTRTYSTTYSENYNGVVTSPAVDTRTYSYSENYSGIVTTPAIDTRTYTYSENYLGTATNSLAGNAVSEYSENYSGIVTKPASDTRQYTQNYSGTAYKSETDNYYGYNVTINYEYETDPSK